LGTSDCPRPFVAGDIEFWEVDLFSGLMLSTDSFQNLFEVLILFFSFILFIDLFGDVYGM